MDLCSRLRLIKHWKRRRPHSLIGKSGWWSENPEIKLFLQVQMERSDALPRCMLCGASWKSMLYLFTDYFKSLEHSFSTM